MVTIRVRCDARLSTRTQPGSPLCSQASVLIHTFFAGATRGSGASGSAWRGRGNTTLAKIRIGTRGSKLALWQAEWIQGQLAQRGHPVEIVIVSTKGDVSTQSLSEVGGQGVFTKEIQRELLAENVDLAVHSLKDLPTLAVEGLVLAAVPAREDTADCLISRNGESFENLPAGARIGTGSSRRGAQLLAWRPEIEIADIRGNVDSRLRKLEEGRYDAIVLAAAGLRRLKMTQHITQILPQERMLPAIGQGALGLECRTGDATTREAVSQLDDFATHQAVTAERSLLASLLAGCLAPVAALAEVSNDELSLRARVCAPDGARTIDGHLRGRAVEAERVGRDLAMQLNELGAMELIAAARR